MGQIELVGADVFGAKQLGRFAEVAGEQRNTLHVDFLRLGRVVAQLQVLDVALP